MVPAENAGRPNAQRRVRVPGRDELPVWMSAGREATGGKIGAGTSHDFMCLIKCNYVYFVCKLADKNPKPNTLFESKRSRSALFFFLFAKTCLNLARMSHVFKNSSYFAFPWKSFPHQCLSVDQMQFIGFDIRLCFKEA